MATVKAIYKCRLCGKRYHTGQVTNADTAEECMLLLVAGVKGAITWAPTMYDAHRCGGDHAGSMGLADFQGWEKEK